MEIEAIDEYGHEADGFGLITVMTDGDQIAEAACALQNPDPIERLYFADDTVIETFADQIERSPTWEHFLKLCEGAVFVEFKIVREPNSAKVESIDRITFEHVNDAVRFVAKFGSLTWSED